MSLEKLHESWRSIIPLLYREPLQTLNTKVLPNCSHQPRKADIFNVFHTPLTDIKVVILGQDPYPSPNVATGFSFAVSEDTPIPVSLRNIRLEIEEEGYETIGENWKTLEHWTRQGVFLLNTALTVETGKAASHLKYWEQFTKSLIQFISSHNPCIWVLWGRKAQKFIPYISDRVEVKGYNKTTIHQIPADPDKNYILSAPHPAAEAYQGGKAGFFGCNHFYFINSLLSIFSKQLIIW